MKYLLKRIKKILLITFFALQAMFVQAQQATNEGEPRLTITNPNSRTYVYSATTTAVSDGNNSIQFDVGGVGVTGWEHTIRYTHPGTYFSITPVDFLIGDGSISVSLTLTGVNTGSERSAVIVFSTVGGATTAMDSVTLTQRGASAPMLTATPSMVTVSSDGANYTGRGGNPGVLFSLLLNDPAGTSSILGTPTITYPDASKDFLTVNYIAALAEVFVNIQENTSAEERRAMIMFRTTGGFEADTVTVTITQRAIVGLITPTLELVGNGTAADSILLDRTGVDATAFYNFSVRKWYMDSHVR